jgi:hypothetical protein
MFIAGVLSDSYKLRINAGDGRRSHLFEAAHGGTGYAFVVKRVDVLSEGFRGMPSQ